MTRYGWMIALMASVGCSESVTSTLGQDDDTAALILSDGGIDILVATTTCQDDSDCTGSFPEIGACEVARCNEARECVRVEMTDCCVSASDCPESTDPCSEATCPLPGAPCGVADLCEGCSENTDCQAVAPICTLGTCNPNGTCDFDPLDICCAIDSDCTLIDPCVLGACEEGQCSYTALSEEACCETDPIAAAGETVEETFLTSSDNPVIFFSIIETPLTMSPPYALYVGNPATLSTATIGDVNASAIFPIGSLLKGAQVDFRAHVLAGLSTLGTQAFLIVLSGEGAEDIVLYDAKQAPHQEWHLTHTVVTLTESTSYAVVLNYQQVNSLPGKELGVLIDNLEIRIDCSPFFACFDASECDDGNPCTTDACKLGDGTANCTHAPSGPLPGVEETCGDGIDNDCDPSTTCFTFDGPDGGHFVHPEVTSAPVNVTYNTLKSEGAGLTLSNRVTLAMRANGNGESTLFLVADTENDGSGGTLKIAITAPVGTEVLVQDDPPGAAGDQWDYDPATGTGEISWDWSSCCVDGLALGHLGATDCVAVSVLSSAGLSGIQVWDGEGTAHHHALGDFVLCGAP